MPTRSRRILSACAVLSMLALSACGASADSSGDDADGGRNPDKLVLSAIPTENSTSLEQSFQGVIAMLEEETGKDVTFQQATSYAAIIEGQRAKKIDIAVYGPFSYVLARNSGLDIEPAAALVHAKGAQPGYRSHGFVAAGSDITSLADAKSEKVCFVEPNSTSGYLYPSAGFIEAGLDPAKDIEPVMAGGHDASVLALTNGQCAVGFAYDAMVEHQLIDRGEIEKGDVTTIWKSEIIPGSPAAVSSDLDSGLRKKIVSALQEKANVDYLGSQGFCEGDDCAVGDQENWGFVQVEDSLYDGVRKVCATTKDEQCSE
ncbi:phosphate/phosphite/phosphonate ABC transporter substrate-binding protein [Streptomyces sp. WMMC1477]|uniref:phosphate/phosphite/phosphonate ABC transporter substrate-binding protein n=1 Tax=Streptomyces sp. WMMC1477 TaxID=3015155 RepID=UPI0022B60DBB|nr:phosphate/phosphite/phosphonate ABC transporter substrate-binding protein [Streptomyces sp. WMMC1477]MCZ7431129.1 phosphate/phosphite/phosphonate ABC transporter substrate-binding protein [Streptomyces sp. WMMC1477]